MLASSVVLGLIAGLAIRRSIRPLWSANVRWIPLLVGSLLVRGIAPLLGEAAFAAYVVALAGTSIAAAANVHVVGAALVALGGGLNLLVVVLNHGMPVDTGAVAVAGSEMPHDALHTLMDPATRLSILGDAIPFALLHAVYSAGDVVIAIGGFLVPFLLLTRR